MNKTLDIAIGELRYAAIRCPLPECGAEILLDMAATRMHDVRQTSPTPEKCPSCGTSFDSAVPDAVDSFRKIYKATHSLKSGIVFRVRQD